VVDSKYDNAVAVTRDIFWIGFYDATAKLHCNPYLLVDDQEVVLFDPGSITDFPGIMRKIIDTTDLKIISAVVVSHQDPDVCGNLAIVEDVIDQPDLKIYAHSRTNRLIRHMGLKSELVSIDEGEESLTLSSGRKLEFIATPYLHAPGAIMTFDHSTGSLFSSDVFGAVSDGWDLFAPENFPQSMDLFHQEYIPANALLKNCMEQLETYDITRILPQHGSIIEGDNIQVAIDHLKTLKCGLDLIPGISL